MSVNVNIDDVQMGVKKIFLNSDGVVKEVLMGYENVNGETKLIYKRKPSKFSELDAELGSGTHVIPAMAIGCAFQVELQPEGGNVQIIVAGMPYNFSLDREGDLGYDYYPSHSYHVLFPSINNPEEIRYLEISEDNNSNIKLKKWFIADDFNEGFSFWRGFKETNISLSGGTHQIPEEAIGCIYKIIPHCKITIEYGLDTKPIYYDRPRLGESGCGHEFGITGMLFFPYRENEKATHLIINPSVETYNLNIISWLYEAT